MKNRLKNIKKTIQTELIKKKGSGIFTLSIVIGVLVPIILFIGQIVAHIKGEEVAKGIPENFYFVNLSNYLTPYANFFFPILMIYCASKIAQIDHKNKGWHLMETLPATKFSVYFSKYLLLITSNFISIVTLLVSTIVFGFLATVFLDIPSDKMLTIPFLAILEIGCRLFVVSLCISALQYGISVLISSFIWPIIIGFLAMLLPLMLSDLDIVLNWYPYQLLGQISTYPNGSDFGYWFTYSELLAVFYTIVFLYIGFNWYRFKRFFNAFFKEKRSLKLAGVLIFSSLAIYFTLIPKQESAVAKTILQGEVLSDKDINTIYVFDATVNDTIAKIPVLENRFKHEFTDEVKEDYYIVQFDNLTRKILFFGEKDSLDISFKLFGRKDQLEVKGTRIAENIQQNRFSTYTSIPFYLDNNIKIEDADFFMDKIHEDWQTKLSKIKSIRTVDNIVPRDDFTERLTMLSSLEFLNYWNSYKQKRATLYSDKTFVVNENMKTLEQSISLIDVRLLSDVNYIKYVLENLIKNDDREVSQDQKYFSAIEKLDSGLFKDRLLYRQLDKSLSESTNNFTRDSLINKYATSITNNNYKQLLNKKFETYNRLSKGVIAPDFIAYNEAGEEFTLDSFKGKLVVIDSWATWCGPCKYQEPYYQRKSLVFKNKPIQFISMNSDAKKEDWLVDIKTKGKSVLQLRPQDIQAFNNSYAINSIPRFILIDKEGKIINADFVRPSDKVFDELINVYLK
jgi:thiol-disulfide isomerase/thioredoxin